MSLVSLLVMPTDPLGMATFSFEHEMAHRWLLGGMSPLDRFSVLPYFVDPQQLNISRWRMNHQQAHNDALTTLPSWFNLPEIGLNTAQNLQDVNWDDPRAVTWWTFTNHMEHYAAMASLPLDLIFW